ELLRKIAVEAVRSARDSWGATANPPGTPRSRMEDEDPVIHGDPAVLSLYFDPRVLSPTQIAQAIQVLSELAGAPLQVVSTRTLPPGSASEGEGWFGFPLGATS